MFVNCINDTKEVIQWAKKIPRDDTLARPTYPGKAVLIAAVHINARFFPGQTEQLGHETNICFCKNPQKSEKNNNELTKYCKTSNLDMLDLVYLWEDINQL